MEKIKQLQNDFESFFDSVVLKAEPQELYAPIAYTFFQKGKHLRPMFCILANDLFGGNFDDAKYPALGLEAAHNATLIHDDIMDEAPLRRGKETVYKKWNPNIAILAGDAMIVMAYRYSLLTPKASEVINVLGRVLIEVCEGQQYDLNFEKVEAVTIPEYLEMIRLKTAVLLAGSLQIGAVIAGADKDDQQRIYDFGEALGMAFQLQDDVLDCYSDVKVFGKVTGGDIIENKKTMMYLKALELATPDDKARLEAIYSGQVVLEPQAKIEEVKGIFDKYQVKEAVELLMADYDRQAFAHLDRIDVPEERKLALRQYAELLTGRKK